jgi:hypothetical protein
MVSGCVLPGCKDFVSGEGTCLPRKTKTCTSIDRLSSSLSMYMRHISLMCCMPLILCEGTLAPMALYISTLVSHNDRAGFIDEPKSSSSTRKTGFHFHLSLYQSESKPTIWPLQLLILKSRCQGATTVKKIPARCRFTSPATFFIRAVVG